MEDTACVWEPSACMGDGNPMRVGNMKAGCGLWTWWIFGNIGGGSWVWRIAPFTEAALESGAVLLKIQDLIFKFRNKSGIPDLLFLTVPLLDWHSFF